MSKSEDGRIRGLRRQNIARPEDFVLQFSEQVGKILGYVLIEQEPHC